MGGLTRKQQRFVDEYITDLNGYQAALRAGYSRRVASKQIGRLLKNPAIISAIDAGIEEAKRRNEITKDYLTLLLREIAENRAAAKNSDRINAIVTLARMHGHLVESKNDNTVQTVVIKQIGLNQEEVPTIELANKPQLSAPNTPALDQK